MNHEAYQQFLAGKVRVAPSLGFEGDPATVNPLLKPMTQAIVPWACRGGRRALFQMVDEAQMAHIRAGGDQIGDRVAGKHGEEGVERLA